MNDVGLLYFGNSTSSLEIVQDHISSITHVISESDVLHELSHHDYDALLIDETIDIFEALNLIERIKIVNKSILGVIITTDPPQNALLRAIHISLNAVLTTPLAINDVSIMAKKLHFASLTNHHTIKKNLLLNQYKNALDSSLNISKTNIHGVITYVNDRFTQLTGYEPNEIIGQTHRLFKHPDTPKEQMADLWKTIKSKRVWHSIITNRTKSGRTFYSDTFIIPLLNEKHEVEEYMDMRIDVTAIQEQKRYMQQILDVQNTIIVVFKEDEIIQCNQRLLDYFNLSSLDEFLRIHQCICDMVVKAPECINAELFKKWIQSQKNKLDIKVALTRHDNEIRIFKVTKSDLETGNNETQTIISMHDVTEMDNYRNALQNKFNAATEEIRNQQDRLIAQSRSAALGEMFDNIAHQWRQPIGAINNAIINAEFAFELGGMSNEEILDTFRQINTYTEFLSKTIDDFRNFSNPDKDKTTFTPHEIIRQTIGIIQGSYSENAIALTYEPTEEEMLYSLYGPQGEFSQVVLNILNNALDAFKEHKPSNRNVEIRVHQQNSMLIIQVKDNAGGISEHVLPKIFDPYFSTKNKAQGTGIGLYMSKTIIEKHFQGRLEATNEGEGALFTITVPMNKE